MSRRIANRTSARMRRVFQDALAADFARSVLNVIDSSTEGSDGTFHVYVDATWEPPSACRGAVAVVAHGPQGGLVSWVSPGMAEGDVRDVVRSLIQNVRGPEPPPRHVPAEIIPFPA